MYMCTSFFSRSMSIVYRPTESRQMGVIDPHSRIMVLHLYAGLLKVHVCIKCTHTCTYLVRNVIHVHEVFVLYINFCMHPGSAAGSEV